MPDRGTASAFVTVRDLNVHFKRARRAGESVRAVDGVDLDI